MGQTLHFIVTNDNNGLFSAQPVIDASGNLTFAPQANVAGSAHVTVVLMDDGGTASGGSDRSDPQSFTISVTKAHLWHNAVKPLDVTGDGHIVAADALEIINFINAFGSQKVPFNGGSGFYYDVNIDGFVAPSDALDIINYINAFGPNGEGEGFAVGMSAAATGTNNSQLAAAQDDWTELIALLALDTAQQNTPRRNLLR